MKFDLNRKEIEVIVNSLIHTLEIIDTELLGDKPTKERKAELEKDRKVLLNIRKRLVIRLVVMD